MSKLPLRIGFVRAIFKELSTINDDPRPLAVDGPLADVLHRELTRGGDANAVRVGDPKRAALYLRVLGREVTDEDRAALKRARRARVPILAVADFDESIPHVLATDVIPLLPGSGFPIEAIAEAIARKLGEDATALAARLPVLRRAVCARLIAHFSRRNAIIAAAVFIPGVDFPVLALNQLRLVLRIGAAHGEKIDRDRLPEVLGTLGVGLGFRSLAHQLLNFVPFAGWALQGGIAYTGTRAIGETAVKWFEGRSSEVGSPVGHGAMPRPAEASPAAP